MKKGGDSESTITIGPSKSILVYALYSLEYVLGLDRFRVFVPKLLLLYKALKITVNCKKNKYPLYSRTFSTVSIAFKFCLRAVLFELTLAN